MSLQKNVVKMLAPDAGVAPNPAAEVIAANSQRGYLLIQNLSDEAVSLGFGGEAAVAGEGIVLPALTGFYEMLNGRNLDQGAVSMISASGGKAVSWQEGDLSAE